MNQPDSTQNTSKPTNVTNPETSSRLNHTSSQIELMNWRSSSPITVNEGMEKLEEPNDNKSIISDNKSNIDLNSGIVFY